MAKKKLDQKSNRSGKTTSRQKKTMNRHARHHSLKHMRAMANAMKKGATFGQAHTRAMRSVGK